MKEKEKMILPMPLKLDAIKNIFLLYYQHLEQTCQRIVSKSKFSSLFL